MSETTDFCHNLLSGVCVLQKSVQYFLNSREYASDDMAVVVPAAWKFTVENGETSIPAEKADPQVTLIRGDLTIRPLGAFSATEAATGASAVMPMTLIFELKTPSYAATHGLSFEIGLYIRMITPQMRNFKLNIGEIKVSPTKLMREKTPNFYFAKVSVDCSVPPVTLKYPTAGDILRTIGLEATFSST